MHYKPRVKPTKVSTNKFIIDNRILDLLEFEKRRQKTSRNKIVELALKTCLQEPFLPLVFKTKKRVSFLLNQDIIDLLERRSVELNLPKTVILSRCLREYLTKKKRKPRC